MAFPDRRTSSIVLTILFYAALLAILYFARRIFVIFAFAILFAYLIDPVVEFLQRHSLFFKNLRGPHILEAYLAFLILLGIAGYGIGPALSRNAGTLFRTIPRVAEDLASGEMATNIAAKYGWTEEQELRLKNFLLSHRDNIRGLVAGAEQMASTLIGALFLIPILAIFFLSSGAQLAEGMIQLIASGENESGARRLVGELNKMFQAYIRAKVILGALSLVYCTAAMLVLGFPHAVALGVAAGILEFVPVAGWITAATTIVSVGIFTGSPWIWMAALLGVWRILIDYWIAPRVVGHELEIHPLLAIFAVMVGGELGGIVGIYLSIPIMAAVRVVWQHCTSVNSSAQSAPAPS